MFKTQEAQEALTTQRYINRLYEPQLFEKVRFELSTTEYSRLIGIHLALSMQNVFCEGLQKNKGNHNGLPLIKP